MTKTKLQNHAKLAEAIIDQAVEDYVKSSVILSNKNADPKKLARARRMKADVEGFLLSQWYGTLTGIEPAYLKSKLDERVKQYIEENKTEKRGKKNE